MENAQILPFYLNRLKILAQDSTRPAYPPLVKTLKMMIRAKRMAA